jgi:large subunit ribosomal protein L21
MNNQYAIIRSGGKQYRVTKDAVIDIELKKEEKGARIEFEEVLFVHDGEGHSIGSPYLTDFFVAGELLDFVKGPKITSVKYQPGNHYKKFGHRQKYCRVKITEIGLKSSEKESVRHGS